MPNFLHKNIDRAIVMTQYDLRGFAHPLGARMPKGNAKYLCALTSNFIAFAAGLGREGAESTDNGFVREQDCTFEDYLAMCKRLVADCDLSEKEAIQFIIQEIVKQMEEAIANPNKGTPDYYRNSLSKDNNWGKVVLALVEAFEVQL